MPECHLRAQAEADPVKEVPHLQGERIGWYMDNIHWQQLRCELRQQFLQSARAPERKCSEIWYESTRIIPIPASAA
jgi:hypothetical protein